MVKDENTELLIDGKRVEGEYTFTADSEEMKVKVEYTFNASALGGKDLVTFEELYDLSDKNEPVKVAEHKDIEDDGQTVTIKEVPETPVPEEPKKPETPSHKVTDSPKTGDNINVAVFAVLLDLSAAGLAFATYKKHRSMKHDSGK